MLSLGAAYFVGTCVLDVMTNVGTIDDLTAPARVFLVLPVAVLDAAFIMWIFTALSRTLAQLQARRQAAKLDLYRAYTNLLAVAAVISVLWIGYEMYFKVTDSFNERWQSDWVTGAFWHVLNLALIMGICKLWQPADTAAQFGHEGYAGERDDWEDSEGGAGALRGGGGGGGGGGGAGGKGAEARGGAESVFSLGDEGAEPSKLS